MSDRDQGEGTITRRGALGAALVATTALGAGAACTRPNEATSDPKQAGKPMTRSTTRMPVAFLPHGGGPWPIMDLGFPQDERTSLLDHLRSVRSVTGTPPKALLVVSAHWEEAVPTVMTAAKPPMYFDYYGFPPEAYSLTWPAPGSPTVAARVRELLGGAGFATAEDPKRGFDHGTFVPLKIAYPEAEIPVVQLSLIKGLDANEHLKLGRAIAPLRDEGVFIIGSGNSFHNMGAFREGMAKSGNAPGNARDRAALFDDWLKTAVAAAPPVRDAKLARWDEAPEGRFCHPREEHLIPLMVIAGAAGADKGSATWTGALSGLRVSSFLFGA